MNMQIRLKQSSTVISEFYTKTELQVAHLISQRKHISHLCLTIFRRLKRQVNYRSY